MSLEPIRLFFDEYNAAFESADSERIAACYHVPCMTLRMDGTFHVFQSRLEISDFFAGVARAYRAEGMETYRLATYEPRTLGSLAAAVTVQWEGLGAKDRTVVRNWWQTYNLRCVESRWLIVLNTNHVHARNTRTP